MDDNLELYEKREKEILEKLGQMELTDPARKPLMNELESYSSIRVNYEQAELTRLNNNARNDIEEAKLIIEQEKVKNDKERNLTFAIQAVLSFFGGAALMMKSYHMDERGYPYKDLKMYGQRAIEKITRGR